jgi:hypothetical protein
MQKRKNDMKMKWGVIPAWFALSWAFAATPALAGYTVVDSEVEVVNDLNIPIAWLDNERVIFTALKPGQPRMQINVKQRPIGRIVIWDTARNKASDYADGTLICYYDGVISYTVQDVDPVTGKEDWIGKSGKWGEEKEVRAFKAGDSPKHRDYHTCRVYPGKRPVLAEGRPTLELKKEHGYLELAPPPGATRKPGAVLYHKADGEVVELAATQGEIKGMAWSDYGQGYMLTKSILKYQDSIYEPISPPVLFLHGDGRLERLPFPLKFFNRDAALQIALTRKGLAFVSGATNWPHDVGRAGLYLESGDDAVRLVRGTVGGTMLAVTYGLPAFVVSPDGCKIAFRHGMQPTYYNAFTIKMINVCE